jgi:zinc transport system substrate-binding protein
VPAYRHNEYEYQLLINSGIGPKTQGAKLRRKNPMPTKIKNLQGIGTMLIITITFAFLALPSGIAAEKLTVYVVNYPLKYFAERIGQAHVNVVFPAPADVDPAYWMPDAKTISDYQQADLILLNGAGYARWVNKATLPQSRMVGTSAGFKTQYLEASETVTHSHGSGGEHAHESLAFTTWIDFEQAARQAKAVADAFSRKEPGLREMFQNNYVTLEKDLLKIDQQLKELTLTGSSKPLIGSHPVYDYFARRYKLFMKSVHWEPDELPNRVQWAELKTLLANHPAKWMIWEGTPMKESGASLKAIGLDSIVFDPCGNTPDQGDLLSVMQQNVENLKPVFQ